MALTYEQQGQEASSALNISRVAGAIVDVAVAVMAESAATDGHDERAALAVGVLSAPESYASRFLRGVLTNANAGTGVDDPLTDDSALEFVVSSQWNAYAGYSATP